MSSASSSALLGLRNKTDAPSWSIADRSEAPVVIMLTARGQDTDIATGLDSGADDYIVKPFAPRELIARIQVVMLRHERQRGETRAP